MSERFGADCLSCAWRPREVERERQAGGVPFAKTPAVEDKVVLRNLCKSVIQRAARCRRQDHIVERAARNDRLDSTSSLGAKQPGKGKRRHLFFSMQDAHR